MPEERKPLTRAPGDASSPAQPGRVYLVPPKPTETIAHLKDPGGPGARCGDGYGFWLAASPSVCKPTLGNTASVLVHGKRKLELCGKCLDHEASGGQRPVNRPLETTMNRYAVASKGRGLTAIVAVPGWMDRQQALNLVAWVSVIAELKDEEILAARRQVEDT